MASRYQTSSKNLHRLVVEQNDWSIHYEEIAPPKDLAPFIVCLWHAHTVAAEGIPPTYVVPDGCVDLIFWANRVSLVGFMKKGFGGQPTSGETWGIRMRPPALTALLHDRPSALLGTGLTCTGTYADLRDQLFAKNNKQAKCNLLWQLCRRAFDNFTMPTLSWYAAGQLAAQPNLPIATLARHMRISERHLHRLFREEIGPSPKAFSRQMRFMAAMEALQGPHLTLAGLATQLGLPDQARLTHECTALTGLTPKRLRAMHHNPTAGLILTRPQRRQVHPVALESNNTGHPQ